MWFTCPQLHNEYECIIHINIFGYSEEVKSLASESDELSWHLSCYLLAVGPCLSYFWFPPPPKKSINFIGLF